MNFWEVNCIITRSTYTNLDSNLETSVQATITQIIVDALESKNGPTEELGSDQEKVSDSPIATNKKKKLWTSHTYIIKM